MESRSEKYLNNLTLFYSYLSSVELVIVLFGLSYFQYIYLFKSYSSIYILLLLAVIETTKGKILTLKDNKLLYKREVLIFKIICLNIITTIIYYGIAVLFGAPITDSFEETLTLSLLLTILTTLPASIHIGYGKTSDILLTLTTPYQSDNFCEMFLCLIRCTIFGAWASAVVIPLDWDRRWQKWPIPCVYGAVIGNLLGHFVIITKMKMKSLNLFYSKRSGKFGL